MWFETTRFVFFVKLKHVSRTFFNEKKANARSASLQTKFEKDAVDNAVDSARSVCRPVRFTESRCRVLGVGGSGRRPLELRRSKRNQEQSDYEKL